MQTGPASARQFYLAPGLFPFQWGIEPCFRGYGSNGRIQQSEFVAARQWSEQ
jgi:hypothetical protein